MSPDDELPSTTGPGITRRVETTEELWALIKFRLVAFGEPEKIEAEIERMVETWKTHIDQTGLTADEFRTKLFNLVREGLDEDRIAYFERRRH
jgi:hypothetical protein